MVADPTEECETFLEGVGVLVVVAAGPVGFK